MRTERLPASPTAIERAARVLQSGGLVAFPTETVYGLGARADDAAAVARIFEAKGRPATNPLIVHARDAAHARELALSWPDQAALLAELFWPGPLTLVVLRREGRIADNAAAGGPTVALRVPAHPVAGALLDACDLPIAAPSANRSTSISPTAADHVLKSLDGRIDMVIDGGPTGYGIESTIVDVTRSPAVILRPGAVTAESLAAHIPIAHLSGIVVDPGQRAPSPGLFARHYAPRAKVILLAMENIEAELQAARGRGERVGVILRAPARGGMGPLAAPSLETRAPESLRLRDKGHVEELPAEAAPYAAGLYAALHRLDDAGCDRILIAAVPDEPAWAAVRDRLTRASA
jgi:L-threonylcarbamoyladenylate synthase